MAAPHQNIADIVVLKSPAAEPDFGDLNLDGGAPVGLRLAAARKSKGLTHAEVHAGTKIKIVHIAAIETGDKAALPATPFTAGFVKAYAQFLGLDADAFARAYKQEAGFAPLAAPVQAAIVRGVMQAHAAETPAAEPVRTAVAPLMQSTALLPVAAAPLPSPSEIVAPVSTTPALGIEADKMVTWLGAGAAIAVVAFIAGRAAQPAAPAPVVTPAPTIIAEAPAPKPVAIEAAPPIELAPQVIKPVEASPAVAAVKPPVVKPKPKKRIVVEQPVAAVEETPAPVLIAAPVAEAPVKPPPAPEPKVIPARVTRAASPEYPERCATRAGVKVGVSVIFSVTPAGKPVSASVSSSEDRCFNSAALRAVYDMRFSPRTVDGVATTETAKTVKVQFVR
jgi:TonB family protein